MSLTLAQRATLKADILVNPDALAAYELGDTQALADLYNAQAAPAYWVWRPDVSRADIYHGTGPDGTTWNWTTYKNQGVSEQNAFIQMFMGDLVNFALANVRAGIGAIFGAVNAQTAHCLGVGRRLASRVERLFGVGTGSTASPAVMSVIGPLSAGDVQGL